MVTSIRKEQRGEDKPYCGQMETWRGNAKPHSQYAAVPRRAQAPSWDSLPLPDLGPKCHMGQWWGGQECRKGFPRGGLRARGEKTFIALVSVHLSSIYSEYRHPRDQKNVFPCYSRPCFHHMQMYANYEQTQSLAQMKETKGLVQEEPSETRPSWQALLAVKL